MFSFTTFPFPFVPVPSPSLSFPRDSCLSTNGAVSTAHIAFVDNVRLGAFYSAEDSSAHTGRLGAVDSETVPASDRGHVVSMLTVSLPSQRRTRLASQGVTGCDGEVLDGLLRPLRSGARDEKISAAMATAAVLKLPRRR